MGQALPLTQNLEKVVKMPVDSIECQIAKGQIGRYLAGESFSPTGLQQLEEHVAHCTSCKSLLAERRQALMKMLGQDGVETPSIPNTIAISPEAYEKRVATHIPAASTDGLTSRAINDSLRDRMIEQLKMAQGALHPASQAPAAEAKPISIAEKIRGLFVTSSPAAETSKTAMPSPTSFAKPVMYTIALVGVMIGMSLITKNGGLMGTRGAAITKGGPAAATTAAPAITVSPSLPAIRTASKAATGAAISAVSNVSIQRPATVAANVTKSAIAARPTDDEAPAPRRIASRKRTAPKPKATTPAGSIRIYGEDGKPVNPND